MPGMPAEHGRIRERLLPRRRLRKPAGNFPEVVEEFVVQAFPKEPSCKEIEEFSGPPWVDANTAGPSTFSHAQTAVCLSKHNGTH